MNLVSKFLDTYSTVAPVLLELSWLDCELSMYICLSVYCCHHHENRQISASRHVEYELPTCLFTSELCFSFWNGSDEIES